jgi:hypothetical protein
MKCFVLALALLLTVYATNAKFITRRMCKACLSLDTVAKSGKCKLCRSKCKEKGIIVPKCIKICFRMNTARADIVCRGLKLCSTKVLNELNDGEEDDINEAKDGSYDTGYEENNIVGAGRFVKSQRQGIWSRCRPGWPCFASYDELEEEDKAVEHSVGMNNACHAKINALKKVVAYLKVKLESRGQLDEMHEEYVRRNDNCNAKTIELQLELIYLEDKIDSMKQKKRELDLIKLRKNP